jgi:hypothetical protein
MSLNRTLLKFIGCCSLATLLIACAKDSEVDVSTAKPDTFVRYFNGGYNDAAIAAEPTPDGGFILLGTTEVRLADALTSQYKVKLIKTDQYGNMIWQQLYPEFNSTQSTLSFTAKSILLLKDNSGALSGYVIVGDSIESNGKSHLSVLVTDAEGNMTKRKNYTATTSLQGRAVAITENGNILALGSAVNSANNMWLAELDKNTLNAVWLRRYGAGETSLSKRIFLDNQDNIYWSGTVTKNDFTDIRLVKTFPNSQNTEFDLPIGKPDFNEQGSDICRYLSFFAVVGTTDEKESGTGDEDILFKLLSPTGSEVASTRYGYPNQAEKGISICTTTDGGFILLGSVETNTEVGRGKEDYYLIKVNLSGETQWTRVIGSKDQDIGSSVRTLSDGSFLVLGTTLIGGMRTMMLLKTDKNGNIQ